MNRKEVRSIPIQSGIYKITSPTGKVYIGQSKNFQKRYREHLRDNKTSETKLVRSFRKHGYDSHTFTILETNVDLDTRELFYITEYDSVENGLNLIYRNYTYHFPKEVREKISNGVKEGWTEERKQKHSERIKQLFKEGHYNNRQNLGKHWKGTMSVRDTRDGNTKRVSRQEYLEKDYYVGITSGMSKPKGKKKVMLVETGQIFSGVVDCYKTLKIHTKKFYDWVEEGKIVYLSK